MNAQSFADQADRDQIADAGVAPQPAIQPEDEEGQRLDDERRGDEQRDFRSIPEEQPVEPEGERQQCCANDQEEVGDEEVAVPHTDHLPRRSSKSEGGRNSVPRIKRRSTISRRSLRGRHRRRSNR